MTALSLVPPGNGRGNRRILAGNQLANSAGTAHDNYLREANEQLVFHEFGAASKLVCELRWICNRAKITVKDHIALIRSILLSLRCVPQITALNDPSDLLTWTVPALCDIRAENYSVKNSTRWLWLIENPTKAHNNYATDKRAINDMLTSGSDMNK